MAREMLDRWALWLVDRLVIEEFMEWLQEQYPDTALLDIHIGHALDRFHRIDQAQLDNERRALLVIETETR